MEDNMFIIDIKNCLPEVCNKSDLRNWFYIGLKISSQEGFSHIPLIIIQHARYVP